MLRESQISSNIFEYVAPTFKRLMAVTKSIRELERQLPPRRTDLNSRLTEFENS
jgi:hypothetical protein